jgi:hypothetical protein
MPLKPLLYKGSKPVKRIDAGCDIVQSGKYWKERPVSPGDQIVTGSP